VSKEKSVDMFKELIEIADTISISKADYKGENPEIVKEKLGIDAKILTTKEVAELIKQKKEPILITGSIYMIGDVKSFQKQ